MIKNKKLAIILPIISIVFTVLFEYFYQIYFHDSFSFDRDLIIFSALLFISCHLIFDINKMYDFIYKKRYIIAAILLVFITIMKYHGLSISMLNNYIQPNSIPKYSNPILGIARGIRSDEWMVSTPHVISQVFSGFNKYNDLTIGRSSLVTLYPALPAFDISILGRLMFIPYLILPIENAVACVWYGKLIITFLATFELFMIITKNKRLYSLCGAVLVVFAPANMWWYSIDMVMWGNLAVLFFYKFLNSEDIKLKILYSILIGIFGLNYIFLLYPAWQVPFGFFYLGIIIWMLIENKKNLSFKLLLYIPLVLIPIILVLYFTLKENKMIFDLINNTVYPGKRFITGGYGYELLLVYALTPFYSFYNIGNPSEASNYIGLFPIPLVMSIIYLVKNKVSKIKIDWYLVIMSFLTVFLGIWNFISLPKWFIKISLLSFSTPGRSQIIIGYISIYVLIYLLSKYETDRKISLYELIIKGFSSFIISFLMVYILKQEWPNYVNIKIGIIIGILFAVIFLALLLNKKYINKYFTILLILIGCFSGALVNPITKGLSVFYEKPVSKEIRKIVKQDKNATWVALDSNPILPNYALANGAKIINSTNFYPNFELWNKLDPDKQYEDIYNRYAHVIINLTYDETNFELLQEDVFALNIKTSDVCKLNSNYIISFADLDEYKDSISIQKIYNEENIYIYSLSC